VPLAISVYDALRFQRPRQTEKEEPPDGSIYDAGLASLQRIVRGSRWRYVPSTSALVLGCYMALGLWSGLNSTYICPLVVGETRSIPLMQWLGATLDSFLAIATYELCLPHSTAGSISRGRGPAIWSTILIVRCSTVHRLYFTDRLQGNGHYLVDDWCCCVLCEAAVPCLASAA
jgi:hypothetical protein